MQNYSDFTLAFSRRYDKKGKLMLLGVPALNTIHIEFIGAKCKVSDWLVFLNRWWVASFPISGHLQYKGFITLKKKSHLKQSNSLLVSPAVIETEGTNFPALTTTSARKEKYIYCCERVIDLQIYQSSLFW